MSTEKTQETKQPDLQNLADLKGKDITISGDALINLISKLVGDMGNGARINPQQIQIASPEDTFGQKVVVFDTNDVHGESSDYLETPAVFFSYTVRHVIWDDTRAGASIKCPGGKIVFGNSLKYKKDNFKMGENPYLHVCMAYVKSKIQLEFLRKHSLNGIKFFEDIKQTKKVNSRVQDALVASHSRVSSMQDQEVKVLAIRFGINLADVSIESLRSSVAKKLADVEILESARELERASTYITSEPVEVGME
jgi:hypothetical protein